MQLSQDQVLPVLPPPSSRATAMLLPCPALPCLGPSPPAAPNLLRTLPTLTSSSPPVYRIFFGFLPLFCPSPVAILFASTAALFWPA